MRIFCEGYCRMTNQNYDYGNIIKQESLLSTTCSQESYETFTLNQVQSLPTCPLLRKYRLLAI